MAAADVVPVSFVQAMDKLSVDFFDKEKAQYEEYIGLEKLSEEFLHLGIPKASDILNAAAGPGILSARLQSDGYCNIDALDVDPDTIRQLLPSGLYRNYICRPVSGLNSTGLKEDIYDAVVLVGGFRPDNISPTAINELMRITKPDGHLLWTLREEYHSKHSDFGLLDDNLSALEREGKCLIMKQGEKFTDPHSGLSGMLYVVRRIDTEDFHPESVPGGVSTLVVDAVKRVREEREGAGQGFYEEWSDKPEEDLVVVGHYTGHLKLCEAFFKLNLHRSVEILDVSCHLTSPGLVGMELNHNGYNCVDGLDHSVDALNEVKATGDIYRNYILGRVAEYGSIPVNDESYDVILMSGGFAPGKILPLAFPELLRVLRPGGYILWTMRDFSNHPDTNFGLFDARVNDLVVERKWEVLVGPVFFENFASQHAGRFYMLRKCHREVFALGSPRHSPRTSPRLSRKKMSINN